MNKDYLTVKELADILDVSRVTIFNRIKNGQIKAAKVGKMYIIDKKDLVEIIDVELSEESKIKISKGIDKVITEYGDVLKKLGKE